MITKRDISTIHNPGYVNRVAREIGTESVDKLVCTFDETLGIVGVIVLFHKGNLLLDRFNILMRRYLEAGLPESCWKEEQHRGSLRGRSRFSEAAGDEFLVFSVF